MFLLNSSSNIYCKTVLEDARLMLSFNYLGGKIVVPDHDLDEAQAESGINACGTAALFRRENELSDEIIGFITAQ